MSSYSQMFLYVSDLIYACFNLEYNLIYTTSIFCIKGDHRFKGQFHKGIHEKSVLIS